MTMRKIQAQSVWVLGVLMLSACQPDTERAGPAGTILGSFDAPDANQAAAVDATAFYAINNTSITRYARNDGRVLGQWYDGPGIIHLDSGLVMDGRLYAAHSNYPQWPMTSSVEIFDAASLEHLESRAFAMNDSSMTWLDRFDGSWWGGFAGYDLIQPGQDHPYGGTDSTRVVRMDDDFAILDTYTMPKAVLDRMRPMSNSGGSWGPDGYLYLTGHDLPEIYVMALPDSGNELSWITTVTVTGMAGQGIAWDRTAIERELWGIQRNGRKIFRIRMPAIESEVEQ